VVKLKMRGASKETKKYMRQFPPGNQRGLFGFNLIKDTDNMVVITEGEFDAMAVHQETGYSAVSLPQGATNLPETLIHYFNKFEKIVLWMDNDEAGLLNTAKIA
jgi:twinkle protein